MRQTNADSFLGSLNVRTGSLGAYDFGFEFALSCGILVLDGFSTTLVGAELVAMPNDLTSSKVFLVL